MESVGLNISAFSARNTTQTTPRFFLTVETKDNGQVHKKFSSIK